MEHDNHGLAETVVSKALDEGLSLEEVHDALEVGGVGLSQSLLGLSEVWSINSFGSHKFLLNSGEFILTNG